MTPPAGPDLSPSPDEDGRPGFSQDKRTLWDTADPQSSVPVNREGALGSRVQLEAMSESDDGARVYSSGTFLSWSRLLWSRLLSSGRSWPCFFPAEASPVRLGLSAGAPG